MTGFNAHKFHQELPDFLIGCMTDGLEEMAERIMDRTDPWDLGIIEGDIKGVLVDGTQVVIIDVTGCLHLYRFKLERV